MKTFKNNLAIFLITFVSLSSFLFAAVPPANPPVVTSPVVTPIVTPLSVTSPTVIPPVITPVVTPTTPVVTSTTTSTTTSSSVVTSSSSKPKVIGMERFRHKIQKGMTYTIDDATLNLDSRQEDVKQALITLSHKNKDYKRFIQLRFHRIIHYALHKAVKNNDTANMLTATQKALYDQGMHWVIALCCGLDLRGGILKMHVTMTNPKDQSTEKYKVVLPDHEYKEDDEDNKDHQKKDDQKDSEKKGKGKGKNK